MIWWLWHLGGCWKIAITLCTIEGKLWRYDAAEAQTSLATFKVPLRVISTADLMEEAVNIALAYGISAYDASYVALSQQVGATLLTLDEKLVRAVAATSYNVRSFNDFTILPLPSV